MVINRTCVRSTKAKIQKRKEKKKKRRKGVQTKIFKRND